MDRVDRGIEVFEEGYWEKLKGYRLGLLSNQASLDRRLRSSREIISTRLPGHLKVLFGPQHGHGGEDQDNMVETGHAYDSRLDIPIFSLYAERREPSEDMLKRLDVLIIDLQDVGTRVYTFASTMLNCLRASARFDKKILIFDRPNPLGGERVEGNLLRPELYSFVGPFRLPMRHGLTMGEMAKIFNHVYNIQCELEIVPMKGWRRRMLWRDTGFKWIMPSPNMPLAETAYVYPGQVLWEGTNLSEGRGTCRPFEIFGAPFLDTSLIRQQLSSDASEGCFFQEISFRPTFQKWEGEICHGFMIHVLDPQDYNPYYSALSFLGIIREIYGGHFEWKAPPYEYEFERLPIDLILGDPTLRKDLKTGLSLNRMEEKWGIDLKDFMDWRRPFLLYR